MHCNIDRLAAVSARHGFRDADLMHDTNGTRKQSHSLLNLLRPGSAVIMLVLSCVATSLQAQDRTESGYTLNWTGVLHLEPGTINNGKWQLAGHSIPVYEADAKDAVDLWKKEYKAFGADFSGSKPTKALHVLVPALSTAPILVLAHATDGAKHGPAKLTLAFCANDSTLLEIAGKNVEQVMHDLAVRLNRAVIQPQVDEQQKLMDKYADKLEGAQKDQAQAEKKAANANEDLEDAKRDKSRVGDKQAEQQQEVVKLQKRYNKSGDADDLRRLTKAQAELADLQERMSRELKDEQRAQKDANKRQDDVPDAEKDQIEYQKAKEKATSELEALKRKLEAVR